MGLSSSSQKQHGASLYALCASPPLLHSNTQAGQATRDLMPGVLPASLATAAATAAAKRTATTAAVLLRFGFVDSQSTSL